jgi:RNA polymerase sigma-70 factor (ECF subfamily)
VTGRVPPPPEDDDADLVRGVATGGETALQALHRRYAPLVFNIACKSLDRSAAEEITQDVFLAVWRKAESFDPSRGSFRTWLLSITHHRILDELRSRSRRPDQPVGVPTEELELSAQDPLPDELVWREYQRTAIAAALSALPESQRRALRLAYFSELSHEAVAEALQVPLGTAKTRIRTGLRRLGEHLGSLVAGLILLVGVPTGFLAYRAIQEEGRRTRALDLLANSQLQALRLVPPGAGPNPEPSPEAGQHASFRGIPGHTTAVLTLSRFPAPPEGFGWVLWMEMEGQWTAVPLTPPKADQASLQIIESRGLARTWPRELRITLERERTAIPTGPTAVVWKRQG